MKITKKKIIWGLFVILFFFITFSIYYLFFASIKKVVVLNNLSDLDICLFETEYNDKIIVFKDIKPEESRISNPIKFSRFNRHKEPNYRISFDCKNFNKNNEFVHIHNTEYSIVSFFSPPSN
jgi:hypothetical protein